MQHRINGSPKTKKTIPAEAATTMSAPDRITLPTRHPKTTTHHRRSGMQHRINGSLTSKVTFPNKAATPILAPDMKTFPPRQVNNHV